MAETSSGTTYAETPGVRERLTLNCRNTRPIARHTAVVSNSKWRVKARVDGRPVDFHPYHGRSGWLQELERLIADLRRDNVPPGRISVLLLKTPRGDEEKHLERMGLRRLSEDDVPHLGSASLHYVTWSTIKATLRCRLRNLLERQLLDRSGTQHTISDAGLVCLGQDGDDDSSTDV